MTELAIRQTGQMEDVKEQVRMIADTEFVPKAIRGNPHAILACVLFGREIGLQPMEALAEVHMIDGRPSLSAKAKLKRAREQGHSVTGETNAERAVVRGKRADTGDEMTVTYTMEDAKRAGLTAKKNWTQHPEDMLWARGVARLCRRLFDDVPGALMLDPDEAELSDEERIEDVVSDLPLVNISAPEPDEGVDRAGAMASGKPRPGAIEPSGPDDALSVIPDDALFEIPAKARHEDRG